MNIDIHDQEQLNLPHVAQPVYFRLCCHCGAIWEPDQVYNFAGYCPCCTGKGTTGREAISIEQFLATHNKRGHEYTYIRGTTEGRPIK